LFHDQYSYRMYWKINLQNLKKFYEYEMYLNIWKLKATTVYQFPTFYLNPWEPLLFTFNDKVLRYSTQCPRFAVE
jgi:hypothetical protein